MNRALSRPEFTPLFYVVLLSFPITSIHRLMRRAGDIQRTRADIHPDRSANPKHRRGPVCPRARASRRHRPRAVSARLPASKT